MAATLSAASALASNSIGESMANNPVNSHNFTVNSQRIHSKLVYDRQTILALGESNSTGLVDVNTLDLLHSLGLLCQLQPAGWSF